MYMYMYVDRSWSYWDCLDSEGSGWNGEFSILVVFIFLLCLFLLYAFHVCLFLL